MFPRCDKALPASTQVKWHEQVKRIVTVAGKDEGREAGLGDLNAEFFFELPHQTRLGGFPRINLTARKLPQPFQMFTTRPFRDQDTPVHVNHGHGGDEENLDQGRPLRGLRECGKYSADGAGHRCVG